METKRLKLVQTTRDELFAMIAAYTPAEKAMLSADWLAQLNNSAAADPWIHGFQLILRDQELVIGQAGFKGPPTPERTVEIAYCVVEEHQGNGYATEAADAMVTYAFRSGHVRTVRAHTLPEPNASTRVLTKCGFQFVGEVNDPEDGLVWRWERANKP